jgi:hypothetical protein
MNTSFESPITPEDLAGLEARLEAAVAANPHCPPNVFLRRRALVVFNGPNGCPEVFVILQSSTWPNVSAGPIFLHGSLRKLDSTFFCHCVQLESRCHIRGGTVDQVFACLDDCRAQGFVFERQVWKPPEFVSEQQALETLAEVVIGAIEAFVRNGVLSSAAVCDGRLQKHLLAATATSESVSARLGQAVADHLTRKRSHLFGFLSEEVASKVPHLLGYFCADTVAVNSSEFEPIELNLEATSNSFICVVATIVDAELHDGIEYGFIGYCRDKATFVSGMVCLGYVVDAPNAVSALHMLADIMCKGAGAYAGISLCGTFEEALADLCCLISEDASFYNEPSYPSMLRGSTIQNALAAAHDFYASGSGEQ